MPEVEAVRGRVGSVMNVEAVVAGSVPVEIHDLGVDPEARARARSAFATLLTEADPGDVVVYLCSSGEAFDVSPERPWIAIGFGWGDADRERARAAGAADTIDVDDLTPALAERSVAWALEQRASRTLLAELRASEEELVRRALFDDLTGLPGRPLLLDRLSHCLERAERRGNASFAVLFLDLDGFKEVNDGFGHDVGDRLLVAVARRLESCVRPGDTVARLAGDEFCVLLEDMLEMDATVRVIERIQGELGRAFALDGRHVRVSCSVGVALGSDGHPRPEDVLRAADRAMYRAKGAGGARWEVQVGCAAPLDRRRTLEDELKNAVRRDQFRVHYQPIVSLVDGSVEGFEALLRWNHPTRGCLGSSEFIDVLCEMGLIHKLGTWTLHQACRQALRWHRDERFGEPFVGFNVSARELWRTTFVDDVRAALSATDLPPGALRLEVPEDALAPWNEAGERALVALRQFGVRVQIDDFGAGAAPVGLLRRRPVDALKFAASALFSDDERTIELTRAMIGLAHQLDLKVTAKGIESSVRMERARDLGCDAGQGFLLGEATAADGLIAHPASA